MKSSITHFQLRNLAWATSKTNVFVVHDSNIVHWDADSEQKSTVLGVTESAPLPQAPVPNYPRNITTMLAKNDFVIAGDFYGRLIAKKLSSGTIVHDKIVSVRENAIVNAIDMVDNNILTSGNDRYLRVFDPHAFQQKASFEFPESVNNASRQPTGKAVAVALDDNAIRLIDGDSGDEISQLKGHEDYSFATGWHPNGHMFATGAQDRTCRVWDVRNLSESVTVLGPFCNAVRSLRFSSCGRFLAMAEPRDFVYIADVMDREFKSCQVVDFFGEIAGICFTPNAEKLYIAISDRSYSSLIAFERSAQSTTS